MKKYTLEELVRLLKIGFYLNVKLVYRIDKLEKALDKACSKITLLFDDYERVESLWTAEEWKEWCMKDAD